MTIPELREMLKGVIRDLRHIERELHRRPILARAKATSTQITPELAKKIVRAYRGGAVSQWEIARRFNVNQGRVSEVLRGKRR